MTDSVGHSAFGGAAEVDFYISVHTLEIHRTKLTQVYSKHGEEGYSEVDGVQ